MIGVIPSPVLRSSVIVIEDPLQPLQVLMQHCLLKFDTLWRLDIHVQLLLVIEGFGLDGVSRE